MNRPAPDDRPILLLLPGLLNDARIWSEVAPALGEVAEVHIADFSTQTSVAEMARSALALGGVDLASGMAPARPLAVAGFSMGGYVALQMMALAPQAIGRLALVSTGSRAESEQQRSGRETLIELAGENFAEVMDTLIRLGVDKSRRGDTALEQKIRSIMQAVGPDLFVQQSRAIMSRADHRAALPAFELPVLVIHGESDRVTPAELSREMAALIPGARYEIVPRAGHMLPLEQPADLIVALKRWLASDRVPSR